MSFAVFALASTLGGFGGVGPAGSSEMPAPTSTITASGSAPAATTLTSPGRLAAPSRVDN